MKVESLIGIYPAVQRRRASAVRCNRLLAGGAPQVSSLFQRATAMACQSPAAFGGAKSGTLNGSGSGVATVFASAVPGRISKSGVNLTKRLRN